MPRAKPLLLGLLLFAGLLSCKTKPTTTTKAAQPGDLSSAASSSTCPTKLALASVAPKAKVDASALKIKNVSVSSFSPVDGGSVKVAVITAEMDSNAEFVYYKACDTSKKCYTSMITTVADLDRNSARNPYLMSTTDGRLPAGDYTFEVRSCVGKNFDTNVSTKDIVYEGWKNHPIRCGVAKSTTLNNFPGTDQPVRDLMVKQLADTDKVASLAFEYQDSIANYAQSIKDQGLLTQVQNTVNAGSMFGQLVDSSLFDDTIQISQQAGALALAGGEADPCAMVTVDDTTGEVTVPPAALAKTPNPNEAAQAAAVTAPPAVEAPAAPPSTLPAETTTAPTPTDTDAVTANTPLGLDVQQMNCETPDNIAAGYIWDFENNVCVPPPPSTVNPAFAPSTTDPNSYLYYGGLAMLAIGGTIFLNSALGFETKLFAKSSFQPADKDLERLKARGTTSGKKYQFTFAEAYRAVVNRSTLEVPRFTSPEGTKVQYGPNKTLVAEKGGKVFQVSESGGKYTIGTTEVTLGLNETLDDTFTTPKKLSLGKKIERYFLIALTSPAYAASRIWKHNPLSISTVKRTKAAEDELLKKHSAFMNEVDEAGNKIHTQEDWDKLRATDKGAKTSPSKRGALIGAAIGAALMAGGAAMYTYSLADTSADQQVRDLTVQYHRQIRTAQAKRAQTDGKLLCELANTAGGSCR